MHTALIRVSVMAPDGCLLQTHSCRAWPCNTRAWQVYAIQPCAMLAACASEDATCSSCKHDARTEYRDGTQMRHAHATHAPWIRFWAPTAIVLLLPSSTA